MHSERIRLVSWSCVFLLAALVAGAGASAQAGTWSYFRFKPGQYLKYDMKSERGLKGWVSIKVDDAGSGALNVTLAGDWTGPFSETVRMKPGMSPSDFIYSAKNPSVTNALASLVDVGDAVVNNTQLKQGFKWSQGDQAIEVNGEKAIGDVKGLLVVHTSKSFGRVQKRTYCVNPSFPLPLLAQVPAANDGWTYELVEKKGM